jgi:hypothetical protein
MDAFHALLRAQITLTRLVVLANPTEDNIRAHGQAVMIFRNTIPNAEANPQLTTHSCRRISLN